MSALLLCSLWLAAGPLAPPPGAEGPAAEGAFTQAPADVSMLLARRAPLALQPLALMAVDTLLPLGGVLVAVGAGALAGAVLGGALLPSAGPGAPVAIMASAGAAAGAAMGGLAAWLVVDVALSTRHGGHVRPARVLFLLPLVLPVLLAGGLAAAWGLLGPRTGSRGGDMAATGALVAALGIVQMGAALAATVGVLLGRIRADHDQGSALWEPAR